jgi:hypothetical protein
VKSIFPRFFFQSSYFTASSVVVFFQNREKFSRLIQQIYHKLVKSAKFAYENFAQNREEVKYLNYSLRSQYSLKKLHIFKIFTKFWTNVIHRNSNKYLWVNVSTKYHFPTVKIIIFVSNARSHLLR